MGFADALEDVQRSAGRMLKADIVLSEQKPKDRDALEEAFRNPTLAPAMISKACRSMGVQLSEGAIRNWRAANGVS